MFKRSIVLTSLFIGVSLSAAPVSLQEAENVAKNWIFEKKGLNVLIKRVASAPLAKQSVQGKKAYRIIQLEQGGWVIVSGDDRATPIIGYGDSPISKRANPAFDEWMHHVSVAINSIQSLKASAPLSKSKAPNKIASLWGKYKVDSKTFQNSHAPKSRSLKTSRGAYDNSYVVRPLLWEGGSSEYDGINWDQDGYYDDSTPVLDGIHTYAGCVATAVGQIMRYHKYPNHGAALSKRYYANGTVGYVDTSFDHSFNWANMPFTIGSINEDVSRLLFDIGVSVEMDYRSYESAAYSSKVPNALKKYFKYEVANYMIRYDYTDVQWHKIMRDQLSTGNPLYYAGDGIGGHAFVIDGYDKDGFYHLNWGWGGSSNGKFLIDELSIGNSFDYSHHQTLISISPHKTSSVIKIYDEGLKTCVMSALDITKESDITRARVEGLTLLNCKEMNIEDVSALENFVNLEDLHLDKNRISDISTLSSLNNLRNLSLFINKIEDISALKSLTRLEHLDLYENLIANISALENMQNLGYLDIGHNYIRDFSAVNHLSNGVVDGKDTQYGSSFIVEIADANLEKCVMSALGVENANEIIKARVESLSSLNCRDRGVSDVSSLENFTGLRDLDISHNSISDISSLKNLDKLLSLRFYSNQIRNIAPLKNLTRLTYLDLWNNSISDIAALRNLNNLSYLDIGKNYITDFSAIDHLSDDVVEHKYDQKNASLNAPSDLSFTNITKNSVTIRWKDNSNNESGFKIFRNGKLIHTTGKNVSSYHDSGLASKTTYKYTVKATTD